MGAVVLRLKAPPPWPLDLAALQPAALAGKSADEIARMTLGRVAVGDVFAVSAGDAAELVLQGGSPLLDCVGAGMQSGTLLVEGAVGALAAAGLRGGRLEVRGDAGDHLGGAAPDSRMGMSGGVVLVRGNAGARAGDRMRRGLLIVEGDAGPEAAGGMIAGTVAVCGAVGAAPGVLMRRGTLLLGTPAVAPPPGFIVGRLAGDGTFLRLLARALHAVSPRAGECVAAVQHRWLGDLAALGKGEILVTGGQAIPQHQRSG